MRRRGWRGKIMHFWLLSECGWHRVNWFISLYVESSYTAALSQCHFRSIIQSIPHTLQHQEISTFRCVTHALVVSQQTHAVMFRLLLFYTESCKIQRGFLQLFPISRCLFTPHFIWVRILCDRGINDKKEQQQSYAAVLLSVADRIIIFAFYRIMGCALW